MKNEYSTLGLDAEWSSFRPVHPRLYVCFASLNEIEVGTYDYSVLPSVNRSCIISILITQHTAIKILATPENLLDYSAM